MTPELHRPLLLRRIPQEGLTFDVVATAAECAALAVRFGLPEVTALTCHFYLLPEAGGGIAAEATLDAQVIQVSVVSLDPFPVRLHDRFRLRFVPAGTEQDDDDPEAIDEIPFTGAVIDPGEVAAEQLALTLDPYPRKSGETLDGPISAHRAQGSPFTILRGSRAKS